ncbi:MAG: glycosyltransferase 87 family protein [Lacunisphaera sp.]
MRDVANEQSAPLQGGPRLVFVAVALLILLLRLWQCVHVPYGTGDLLRQLGYALAVKQHGLSILAQPLKDIFPSGPFHEASWADRPYNYPPGAIAFFCLVTLLHPSIFALKFALTATEAINAVLFSRLVQTPWAGLCYWASPLSVWWVSREGQFEPVQTLPLLAALLLGARSPAVSGLLFAAAVQTKIMAVLALPWWAWLVWRQGGRPAAARSSIGFVVGFAPVALACAYYPLLAQIASSSGGFGAFNPWHWAALFTHNVWWWPAKLVIAVQIGSLLTALVIAWLAWRADTVGRIRLLAPAALWTASKFMAVFQPWYWLLLQGLAGCLVPRRQVLLLGFCLLLLDPLALLQLVTGPHGPVCFPQHLPVFAPWTPSHP